MNYLKENTILHYNILEKIGQGGMGVVYKAQDTRLERIVALKFLKNVDILEETSRARFYQEAKSAASLNHPNICAIYDINEIDDRCFISMEYIDGKPLKNYAGQISEKEVIDAALQIARGLSAAHDKGIIHRDIKPDNIFLTNEGQIKITDFGLAKIAGKSTLSKPGEIFGTTAYMSPEQTIGEKLDFRSDIFSFGTVLYELFTGHHPFTGEYDQAIIYSIINEDPLPISAYTANYSILLSDLIFKCLGKTKEERYNSFKEIVDELQSLQLKDVRFQQDETEHKMEFLVSSVLIKNNVCIGREAELEILSKITENLKSGNGKTVFVEGEPGIGKTQLISCMVKSFTGSGYNILYGRCLFNNEGGLTYHPFVNAVRDSISDDKHFINTISKIAYSSGINISQRIPFIKAFLNISSDKAVSLLHKEQLWDAVLVLFKIIAADKPLLLILDDIQWADKISLGLFLFISRNILNIPIALIGLHRPPETTPDFDTSHLVELIRQLIIEDLAVSITLKRLSEIDTSSVISKLFNNQAVDKKLSQKVFHESEGNPLFIYELVNLYRDKELVKFDGGTWKLTKEDQSEIVSQKVQDVIKQRIDYLNKNSKELLQLASCEGEYFHSDILAGTLNINRIELLKLLQSLENEYKLIHYENKSYRFDHILIREVLYESVIPELREEYHKLISEWLIANHGSKEEYAAQIAHQLISAGEEIKSVGYLLRAANRARDLHAVEEALSSYNKLQTIIIGNSLDDPKYKLAVEEGLGDVHITLGSSEEAYNHYQQYLDAAREQKNEFHLIRALRKFAECNRVKGNPDYAEKLCADAIEMADKIHNNQEKLEALNTLAFTNASRGNYIKTIEISREALILAEELKDKKNKSVCIVNMGFAYWHMGNYPAAKTKFLDALSIQRSIGDNKGLSTTLNFLGMAHWKLGQYEDALKSSEESIKIKEKIADYRNIPGSINVIGDIYRDIGDIEKAINCHSRSLELATEHQNKGAMCDNLRDLGEDYFLLGDIDKALHYYNEVLQLAKLSKIKWYETRTYLSLSGLYLSLGNLEKAKENITPGMENSLTIGAKDLVIEAKWNLAQIKAKENHIEESETLYTEAIQNARETGHYTFLWKLLKDYGSQLYSHGEQDKAKAILREAKEIVKSISSSIKDELLLKTFNSTKRVKELIN